MNPTACWALAASSAGQPFQEMVSSLIRSLAYFSIPILFLKSVSYYSPITRYYARVTGYVAAILAASFYALLLGLTLNPIGHRYYIHYLTARAFYFLGKRVTGITYEVEGEHRFREAGPAVLIGNHQSMLDILYLGRIFPPRSTIVAKKELSRLPIFGQYLSISGTVFLNRSNSATAVESLVEAAKTIKTHKIYVWLFPEGTRSLKSDNTLLPFKKGAFHLAIEAGVPIIPVVCENYWRLYRPGIFNPGKLKIKVLDPIPTTGLTTADVSSLALRAHEVMEAALNELSPLNKPPIIAHESKPATVVPVEEDKRETFADETAQEVELTNTKRRNSEGSVVETESDEGMVVIRKT